MMKIEPKVSFSSGRSKFGRLGMLFLLLSIALLKMQDLAALECFDSSAPLPQGVDSETGYRMQRYRAPVPDSLPGGCVATTADVLKALQSTSENWLLIDVYPPKGMGADPFNGNWLNTEEHDYIDGSVWLPEVGRGHLETDHVDYFQHNLKTLSDDNIEQAIVFYCTADCWQSWNAARRALQWGYKNVIYYPAGTDGWLEDGHPLVEAIPVNFLAWQKSADTDTGTTQTGSIWLIEPKGDEILIGTVDFSKQADKTAIAINVSIEGELFTDHFLSMRPFKCIEGASEWFCYLQYPYALQQVITRDDLSDLEYQLLFVKKKPSEFGIDAWNGLYYRLSWQQDGSLIGTLLEGDLNVLQHPPEDDYAKLIDLNEFIEADQHKRLYPKIHIRFD